MLHRLRVNCNSLEVEMFAFPGDVLLSPKPPDNCHSLFHALATAAFRYAKGVKLHVAIALAYPKDKLAAGDDIQCRSELGGLDRVMHTEQEDRRSHRHPLGLGSQPCQQGDRLEHPLSGPQGIVMGGEDPIETALPRDLHLPDSVLEGPGPA